MLGETDLTDSHEIEGIRRSIAMLTPGQPALNREEALKVLAALIARVEDDGG